VPLFAWPCGRRTLQSHFFAPSQKIMRALATLAQAALNLARLLREFPTAASRPTAIAVVEVGHGILDAYLGLNL
jgi:hypothetical protein